MINKNLFSAKDPEADKMLDSVAREGDLEDQVGESVSLIQKTKR